MKNKNIILIGLMGVGKSSVGKELAQRLSKSFVDTDALIEELEGKSIQSIFEEHGEEYFRTLEKTLLEKSHFENTVIAVGGGLPIYNKNIEKLNELGVCIYLRISPVNLSERLWMVRKNRPLLKSIKTLSELSSFLEEQLSVREKYYESASYKLNIDNKASCEIVEDLRTFIKNLN